LLYFTDSSTCYTYTLSLHDALPILNPLRNKRDVWIINTVPFKGGHYAAYPPKLVETCLLAGCPKDGVVLDPFMGSGTTGMAAKQDRKSTRLNSSHVSISYAVFCLKK